jgi:putative spermidine/putrescine transport system ATP-binding protein
VYESPATQFVAQFVGTSNLISAAAAEAILGSGAGVVAVRPEKIRVGAGDAPPAAGEVTVTGRIREIVYAGAQTRVVVAAEHDLTLSAVLLNASPAAPDLHRGDRVTLTWDRAAARPLST